MKPTGVKGQMNQELAEAIKHNLTVGEIDQISEELGRGTKYAYKLVNGLFPETEKSQVVISALCKAAKAKSDRNQLSIDQYLDSLK